MSIYPDKDRCPICLLESSQCKHDTVWLSVNCPSCGEFIITAEAIKDFEHKTKNDITKRTRASHYIYKQKASKEQIKIYTYDLDKLINFELPTITEQAENLLVKIATETKEPGKNCRLSDLEYWLGATGAKSGYSIRALSEHLEDKGYLKYAPDMSGYTFTITISGWLKYENILKSVSDSTVAFMAMKFGDEELNTVVNESFIPAVKQTGFRLQNLNDEQGAGLIDDQLRVKIRRSRFVIADLTHGNNGAYWEAGMAEGLGRPVIYTCKKSVFDDKEKKPHFDTNHYNTVIWDSENLKEAAKKLKATIRATFPEAAIMQD